MYLHVGILICTCGIAFAAVDIASIFHENKIIPDIADVAPNEVLEVYFDGKPLIPAEKWEPYDTRNIPNITWPNDPNKYYTLVHLGVDFPSRESPKWRNFVMLLMVNIPGNDLCKGQTLTVYTGAAPYKDRGLGRCVFMLHEQTKGKMEFVEPYNGDRKIGYRMVWSYRDFLARYPDLSPVLRGNLYWSEYDEFAGKITKEFMAGRRSQNTTSLVEYEHCKQK